MFFSNATLEQTSEPDEDLCHIVTINIFVMGRPIRITERDVATSFNLPDRSCRTEHEGFPSSMLIPNDNALDLPLNDRLLHLFVSHFFHPIGLKHTMVRQIDYWFIH